MDTWRQLWSVVLVTPGGLPMTYKVRAPSEAVLRDRLAHYRPECAIAVDANGVELIAREEVR